MSIACLDLFLLCAVSQLLHSGGFSDPTGTGVLAAFVGSLALSGFAMAVAGHKTRQEGARSKAATEQQRLGLWEKTSQELDRIVAEYHAQFPRRRAKSVGAIYARYSTRHQDSIADQVRKILEESVRLEVYVPREFIFFDLAVRGFKKHREGLDRLRAVLKSKKVGTLLLFGTNRLFRKVYRTLEFVDQVHKGWGIRCVFVKSGVDTDDKQRWETILHAQSMIDQFVVTMYVDNVRAAHEGLLEKRFVFGTLSFGYRGKPIEGVATSRGRPRCEIAIDDATSKVVRQVFTWYVDEGVSVEDIIRSLNADSNVPLPPRSQGGCWKRGAVVRLLRNTRYRGLWQYGVTEAVYVPDGDYVRQNVRLEPLKQVTFEELRLVDDATWFAAQTRLVKEAFRNRGRRSADGDRQSRPKLLNGFFLCPKHDQILYVGGANGRAMFCPRCRETRAEDRPLYSQLNRQLALKLVCDRISELLRGDAELMQDVVAVCAREAELAQKPCDEQMQVLKSRRQQVERNIDFNRRNPGDTEEDQAATAAFLSELRRELNEILGEIARLDKARNRKPIVPTPDEVCSLMDEFGAILSAAADGVTSEETADARAIIELLTGGRIDLYQMGERAPKRGWLQGRFHIDVVSALATKITGVRPLASGTRFEVVIDFKRDQLVAKQAEEAMRLYSEGKLGKEIAATMGVCPSYVSNLLDRAFAARGIPRPDGRCRRKGLADKQVKTPVYKRISEEAACLMQQGWSDLAIARHLKTSDATVGKAFSYWHELRGLPRPTSSDRRRMRLQEANRLYEDGMPLKDIAARVGYSPRGLKLALKQYYAELGVTMPDGRSRRGKAKTVQHVLTRPSRQ